MDKLNMKSKNILGENIEFIASKFPNVITETKDENGNLTRKIDFELLMQELSGDIVEGNKERYQLTWPGKKEAILNANTPINKTLRPVIEDSVDFENTENLYIEGDNLEVLKLLQESYLGKIKCIYIDPPYNTGEDFIYNDNFKKDLDEYLQESGQVNEEGYKVFQNTDTRGTFHSDWMTMIYSRIKLAKNLLTKDGIIFISISDKEVTNLTKICNEIFGEHNFVNNIVVKMSEVSGKKMAHANKRLPKIKEYILMYKNGVTEINKIKVQKKEWDNEYNIFIENFTKKDKEMIDNIIELDERTNKHLNIVDKILENVELKAVNTKLKELNIPLDKQDEWKLNNAFRICRTATSSSVKRLADEKRKICKQNLFSVLSSKDKLLYIVKSDYSEESTSPRVQVLFAEDNLQTVLGDIWVDISTTGLEFEGGVDYKNGKKPLKVIDRLINLATNENDIVMDFFSGSSTTAESIFRCNLKDNKKRKFIMVQESESLEEQYKNTSGETKKNIKKSIDFLKSIEKPLILSEIGKERIRRAAQKIKQETNADIDYGFRVYKVDSTNMKDTYYNIEEISQTNLFETESNIKEDRTPEDLLTQVILDLGLKLSLKIEEKHINGKKVFYVDEDSLVACFDEGVDKNLATIIAKDMPMKVVFRDSCFINDSEKENIKEIFKKYSPDTDIKVL